LGDVVINPENGGTGYKLKTLEALAYGMPLVATTAGAIGVAEPFKNHLFIADSPKCFADAVNKLFHDTELLKTISTNAHQWIKEYKEKLTREFLQNSPA
ncbi:MAG: glycosyltransferase, partial [Ferruginibacter sp.]